MGKERGRQRLRDRRGEIERVVVYGCVCMCVNEPVHGDGTPCARTSLCLWQSSDSDTACYTAVICIGVRSGSESERNENHLPLPCSPSLRTCAYPSTHISKKNAHTHKHMHRGRRARGER